VILDISCVNLNIVISLYVTEVSPWQRSNVFVFISSDRHYQYPQLIYYRINIHRY
jgi:hypothetical protein